MLCSLLQIVITCWKVRGTENNEFVHFLPFWHFRIGDSEAIHAHTHQHAVLNPAPRWLPLRSSLCDPHPLRPAHASEPVAACPPHALRPAAAGPEPAPACHDHSPAHHGHVHHHGNHLIAGHGQPGRAQFHQRGQLCVVSKSFVNAGLSLAGHRHFFLTVLYCCACAAVLRPWWVDPTPCWVQVLTWVESCHLEGWCPPCSQQHRLVRDCQLLWLVWRQMTHI